jgi:prophage antirepressor-like protein
MVQTIRKTPAKPAAPTRTRRATEEREIAQLMARIDRTLEELHAQADETMRRLGIPRGA